MRRTQSLHPWLKPLCFFVAYQPKWKPTWEATHVVQPISKSQDPIWYIRNGKKIKDICQIVAPMVCLADRPGGHPLNEKPHRVYTMWHYSIQCETILPNVTLFYPMWDYSIQCDSILHNVSLFYTMQCVTVLYNVTLFYTMWHYCIQCDTILNNVTLFYPMWHYSIQCDTILHNVTLFYPMWHCSTQYVTRRPMSTLRCASSIIQMGAMEPQTSTITLAHFAKSPLFIWNPWPRQSGMPQKHQGPGCRFLSIPCLPSSEGIGAGTRVSELVTLTKRLSKSGHSCLFIQLFNFGI